MPLRPKTRYACDEIVFHSNVKVFDANLNLKNVKAFQKDTHVISTPTKKNPRNIQGWCGLKVSRCTIHEDALGKLVSNDDGNLSIVRCKMCTKIECKYKMLVPKWDSF